MIGKILRTYGRKILLVRGKEQSELRGFLQADTGRIDRLMELHPGPTGLENRRRYVFIGLPEQELREDDELRSDGMHFLVRSAQLVYGTDKPAYVWAMCVEKEDGIWAQNGSDR